MALMETAVGPALLLVRAICAYGNRRQQAIVCPTHCTAMVTPCWELSALPIVSTTGCALEPMPPGTIAFTCGMPEIWLGAAHGIRLEHTGNLARRRARPAHIESAPPQPTLVLSESAG